METIPEGRCGCGCGQITEKWSKTRRGRGRIKGQHKRFVLNHHLRIVGEASRFRSKSDVDYVQQDRGYETPCWVWQRALSDNGYGTTKSGEKTVPAHRAYYEEHKGPIPPGLELDHLCAPFGGPRSCVNPDHLEPVTRAKNSQRGRGAKLTEESVRAMRRMRETEGHSYRALGRMFGVDSSQVSRVLNGQSWK